MTSHINFNPILQYVLPQRNVIKPVHLGFSFPNLPHICKKCSMFLRSNFESENIHVQASIQGLILLLFVQALQKSQNRNICYRNIRLHIFLGKTWKFSRECHSLTKLTCLSILFWNVICYVFFNYSSLKC